MSARRPARIGRYEVLDRLGTGGMGAVYLASDPLLGRTVAVKVLRTDDDELRERFAREARSAASLKHHHIVTIYDIGEDDEGRPFLAMEYIDGESMAEVIRRRAPLALHQRLKYIIDLCAGLGYAHRTGIIHRDIKPANLMITSEGVLKIVDFGLARVVASSAAGLTRAGTLLGTVHYMSPEQTDGTVVDHLSDIFSVGLVLYEILAYRKAYPGDSAPVVLHNIVHTDPTPIGELLSERDEELEWIVARAIEKQRARRYQDLRELASALEPVRARLEAADPDATIVRRPDVDAGSWRNASTADVPAQTDVSPNAMSPSPRPASADPRHRRSLDVIAQRRAAQIAQRLAAAVEHFAAGRYEEAVEQCEAAILINPEEARALQLLEQAHQALIDRQITQWVAEAKAHLGRGALSHAEELVEQALQLQPDSPEAIALRDEVRHTRRERERAADRARAVEAAIDRARRSLQAGALEAAVRAATEALAYDPGQREAANLRDQASAALEARRQQQEHDQAAADLGARARELADAGDHSAALALLRGFRPPHAAVDEAIAEIEARIAALERQRREEAERARLRAVEEMRRREQLAALRATTVAALERDDYAAARATVRQARREPLVPGDADLERLCAELETTIDAAEADARLRASLARHLQSVHAAIAAGDFMAASKSAEAAVSLAPDDAEAQRLQRHVRELKNAAAAAAEVAAQRRAALERQITAAQAALAKGDIAAAVKSVELARSIEPGEPDVLALQQQIRHAQEAKQRDERHHREAAEVAARARQLADTGDHAAGLELLRGFRPPHAAVEEAIAELEARIAALERERREEAERARLRAVEEAHRREQLAALRATTAAALDRGDYTEARAAVRLARRQPRVPVDEVLERLCAEIDTAIDAAEAAARLRASVERHLKSVHAAIEAGDLAAATKSVDAAVRLAPDDAEARRVQRHVRDLKSAAEAAAQQRAAIERQITAAHAALAKGDIAAAGKFMELALRLAPDEPDVLNLQKQIRHAREAKQRDEQQRLEREQRERAQREREQREREQREREQKEQERKEREQREREKKEHEKKEQEKKEHERKEREKREREERERQAREAAARAQVQERERRSAAREASLQDQLPIPTAQEHALPPQSGDMPLAIDDITDAQARTPTADDQARRRFVAGVAAAAIVAVLAVGGGWWALRDRPVEAPSPAPPAPAPVSYANELAAARAQYQSGDLVGAVRRALAIPTSAPESNDVTALLRDIRGEAQRRAQNARQSAERGGQANASPFSEAAAKDAEAANLTRPQDLERVLSLYEEAAALYRKAETVGASVDELMQRARAEAKANRVRPGVAYALQVLDTNPRHPEALALLRNTREQAQKLAQTAAADARRVGLSIENSPAFKDAVAQQSAAARITNPQDTLRAYDAFVSVAARYRDASEQFKADSIRRLAEARTAREQAEQRLQSGDLEGAAAAIQQAERLEPNAPSMPSLRKRLADARASKTVTTPSAEIDQALMAAGKVTDDPEALKMLTDMVARYPNDQRVAAALRARRQARDNKVAELIRRAQPAADAQAVELLDEALRLDPSRQDLLSERDRRRAAITAGRVGQELRNVVARLEAAYESGNVAEILRIAPVMDRTRLEAQFKSFSIRWDVEPCTARIDPNGTTASLTCVIHETAQPAGIRARVQPTTQTRQFAFTNVNGTWRITAQQIQ